MTGVQTCALPICLYYDTQLAFARLLEVKTDLSVRIKEAYREGDKQALAALVEERFPLVRARLETFHDLFRTQWHTYNKAFGFEVQDLRLGGIVARLDTAELRLQAYICGEVEHLEELEQEDLPFSHAGHTDRLIRWGKCATASVLSW